MLKSLFRKAGSFLIGLSEASDNRGEAGGSRHFDQLIIPVNFNTLNSKTLRGRYLKLCEDIPAAFRRFLLFEICNIPSGTPGGRILDLLIPLNSYAHGTFIEVSHDGASTLVEGALSAIVGVVISAAQFRSTSPGAQEKLDRFVRQSTARNLKVLLGAVDKNDQLRNALNAGVDCMYGGAIAPSSRDLRTVYHWDLGRATA